MKEYLVLEPLTIVTDVVKLTKEQAEARAYALSKGKKTGEYVPSGPLSFKAGEVVGLKDAAKNYLPKLEAVKK